MSEVPVQLIVAAFNDEQAAGEVYDELRMAKWAGAIGIENAAVIRRDEKNKVHIKERGDPGGAKGAVIGGVVGGIIGALAGPAGVAVGAAAGAAVGGATAKVYDSGIPDERLEKIGEALTPGSSAIVALIEHKWVAEAEKEMAEAGANVMTEALSEDIAKQLAEGKDVAFSAVAVEGAVAVERVAGDEDEADMERIIATDEGVAAIAVETSEEGTSAAGFVATDEGAVAFTAAPDEDDAEGGDEQSETDEAESDKGQDPAAQG